MMIHCSYLGQLLLGSRNDRIFLGSAYDWFHDRVDCTFPCSARYVLSQSTPFVTSLYSIFLWKEFKGASKKTWTFEILMLLSLATSMVLLCLAKTKESIVCYQSFIRSHAFSFFRLSVCCDHRGCTYSHCTNDQLDFQSYKSATPCYIEGPLSSLINKTHELVERIMGTKFEEYEPIEALAQRVGTVLVGLWNRIAWICTT